VFSKLRSNSLTFDSDFESFYNFVKHISIISLNNANNCEIIILSNILQEDINLMEIQVDHLIKQTIGGYYFIDLIGYGGSSKVYLVESVKFSMEFVAKVITVDKMRKFFFEEQFKSEIKALRNLDHPNVILLYDFFVHEDKLILILEKCKPKTLKNEIETNGPLSLEKFIDILKQIVEAIEYSHQQGIAHHDIKPQNILFSKKNRPKIADFGICVDSNSFSVVQNFCCTVPYAAPEVLLKKHYDPMKADIWSLGITLYYCIVGYLPFQAQVKDDLTKKIVLGLYDIPQSVPTEIAHLLRTMIQVNPDNRADLKYVLKVMSSLETNPKPSNFKKFSYSSLTQFSKKSFKPKGNITKHHSSLTTLKPPSFIDSNPTITGTHRYVSNSV